MNNRMSFEEFDKGLAHELFPLGISTHKCDFFENICLQLAGINTIPRFCSFGAAGDETKLEFAFSDDLLAEETAQFLRFLKKDCGDPDATYYFHKAMEITSGFPGVYPRKTGYYFEIDMQSVRDFLFPLFCNEVMRIRAEEPERLNNYRVQSQEDDDLLDFQHGEYKPQQLVSIKRPRPPLHWCDWVQYEGYDSAASLANNIYTFFAGLNTPVATPNRTPNNSPELWRRNLLDL